MVIVIIGMMKTLHQSLIDYDLALLKAIADCRGIPLDTESKREAITIMEAALLSPAAIAIVIDDLLEEEEEAFQFLLDHDGHIEGARFTRQFGVIRQMGPARLAREQPWQKAINPAEGLWYKGLIFKTFHNTLQGNSEIVYIPTDYLSLLTPPSLQIEIDTQRQPNLIEQQSPDDEASNSAKIFRFPARDKSSLDQNFQTAEITTSSPQSKNAGKLPYPTLTQAPTQIISGQDRLRESMFSLLVYLQTHPIRLNNDGQLPTETRNTLIAQLPSAPYSNYLLSNELDLLLHLGERTQFLNVKHGRIKPERDSTRMWLQANEAEQRQHLQNTWRADPTWNDLWHVPGLVPQPTGWENSPLLARSKILGYLAQAEVPIGAWLSLDSFVAAIKRLDPDFQRPNGDYTSWYISDTSGNSLMGFEHWDQVEGALIRYLITQTLLFLGVVDIGTASKTAMPSSFRLNGAGHAFLTGTEQETQPKKPLFLRVGQNFKVQVPYRVSLYDRFQLARFAELDRREENRTIYQITQSSMGRALRNGVTADQIVAFLARATNNQTPLKIVETLRVWGTRQGTAYLDRVTLLRLKHENQLKEIMKHPTLKPLLGEVVGPTAILVPSENTLEIRRILIELGYLNSD